MEKLDIYNCKRKLQLAQDTVRNSPRISEANKKDILAFNNYCFADGLGVDRVIHYTWILKRLAEEIGKDFRTAKKEDIVRLVGNVEARKISAWTKHNYRITLRKFFRWLKNKPNPKKCHGSRSETASETTSYPKNSSTRKM